MSSYDDIINLPHYRSSTRKPMSMEARAAQFAPFAAVSGHEDAIAETARFTDSSIELTEDEYRELSIKLMTVMSMSPKPVVKITYFCRDSMKPGGMYKTETGCVVKVDETESLLVMDGDVKIPLDLVTGIDGDFL